MIAVAQVTRLQRQLRGELVTGYAQVEFLRDTLKVGTANCPVVAQSQGNGIGQLDIHGLAVHDRQGTHW
ncbi:hypothetical protein D3C78_1679180 [compost metagenome]